MLRQLVGEASDPLVLRPVEQIGLDALDELDPQPSRLRSERNPPRLNPASKLLGLVQRPA